MALVCSGGHHKAQASVNDALADDIITQRPLDIRRGGQSGAAQEELAVGIHGHEAEDLQRTLDEGWSQ